MAVLFKNDFLDGFGTWALGYIPYGGADFGEVQAVAQAVGEGDENIFYDAWVYAAERLIAEAEGALAKGHRTSARELFLRASSFYASAYHPIFGCPVDALKVTVVPCNLQTERLPIPENAAHWRRCSFS
jgi:hypothetical protein